MNIYRIRLQAAEPLAQVTQQGSVSPVLTTKVDSNICIPLIIFRSLLYGSLQCVLNNDAASRKIQAEWTTAMASMIADDPVACGLPHWIPYRLVPRSFREGNV